MCLNRIFFVEQSFQDLLARLNINLIDERTLKALLKFTTPEDIARNVVIDSKIRENIHFSYFGDKSELGEMFASSEASKEIYERQVLPLVYIDDFRKDVFKEFTEVNYLNMMGDRSNYRFTVFGNVLVVGVEPGFLSVVSDAVSIQEFFQKALETYSTFVSDSDLTGSKMFGKFVQLSISL